MQVSAGNNLCFIHRVQAVSRLNLTFLLATLLLWTFPAESGPGSQAWDYGCSGPMRWFKDYPQCHGRFQSPVDVSSRQAVRKIGWGPLRLSTSNRVDLTLANKGLSLHAALAPHKAVQLTGGPLGFNIYQIAQFHIHFAADGPYGSEHTIDGIQTEAEVHIVTYNTRYGTLANAFDKPKGLAVIGAMIKAGSETHSDELNTVFSEFSTLTYKGHKKLLRLALHKLLPHDFHSNFYTYDGSLTTPPCSETVTWLLARRFVTVPRRLIHALSTVYTGENATYPGDVMSGNFRPIQPLFGRTVYFMDQSLPEKLNTTILPRGRSGAGAVFSASFVVLPLAILTLLSAFRL